MMVGGGVRGKDVGIALVTTIQVGVTIEGSPHFIDISPRAGEMTIGSINGEDINGITGKYLTSRYNRTGEAGKIAGIGINNKTGGARVCSLEGNRSNRLVLCVHDSRNRNYKM